jgi:hypothetical protein
MQELFRQFHRLLPVVTKPALSFAEPGKERQDSVFNGFQVSALPTPAASRSASRHPHSKSLSLSCMHPLLPAPPLHRMCLQAFELVSVLCACPGAGA